jgi:hypothetical protein
MKSWISHKKPQRGDMKLSDIISRAKKLPALRVDNLLLYVAHKAISRALQKRGVVDISGRLVQPRIHKPRFVKPSKSFRTLVSVGGFGWSGSSAVVDLLSEYSNVTASYAGLLETPAQQLKPVCFEFELARSAGGLFGLENAFRTHSFFERDMAIRIFAELAEELYITYSTFFGEEFVELTASFLERLIQSRAENTGGGFDYCHHLSALGTKAIHRFLGRPSDCSREYIFFLNDLSIKEYRALAHEYLSSVLAYIKSDDMLVLDQATSDECFDVEKYQEYFGPIKSIFVWRDPRDVYVAAQTCTTPESNLPKDPDGFCSWYSDNVRRALSVDHEMWLTVRFEDLLYSYNTEVRRIEEFLGLKPQTHVNKMTALVPSVSIAQSVGLWRTYSEQKIVANIQSSLSEYCFEVSA